MNDTIAILVTIFVIILVALTGGSIFLSDRMVKKYKAEAEKAVAKAKRNENALKAEKAEADMVKAGVKIAEKVYKAVRVGDEVESIIGANTSPTELSEEEKRIAKEVSEKPDTDCQ